ncbi:MAG: hypothetical protein ACR2FM_02570 [Candidatus Saccharimonadales bacterium]
MVTPDIHIENFVKEHFGRKNSLPILQVVLAYTVEPPQRFNAQLVFEDVQDANDSSTAGHSTVSKELQLMTVLGMIVRGEKLKTEVPYTRTDSPLWEPAKIVVAEWARQQ